MKRKNLYKLGGIILGVVILLNFGSYVDAEFDGVLNAENLEQVCDFDSYRRSFNCRNRGITRIAPGTFDGYALYQLMLEDNKLSYIDSGTFRGLTVSYLYLSRNQISSIDTGVFYDLNLASLFLDDNKLKVIKKGIFDGLTLSQFWLGRNQISEIESGAFYGTYISSDFTFDGNRLGKLENGMFNGMTANYLHLNSNQISEIESGAFEGVEIMYELGLGYNRITYINEGLFAGLSSLRELYLNNNYITNIDKGVFSGLENLEYLDLSGNPLVSTDYSDFEDMGINPNIRDGRLTAENLEMVCSDESFDDGLYVNCSGRGIISIAEGTFDGLDDLKFIDFGENYTGLDVSGIESLGAVIFTGELNKDNISYVCDVDIYDGNKYVYCDRYGIKNVAEGTFNGLEDVQAISFGDWGVFTEEDYAYVDEYIGRTTLDVSLFDGLNNLKFVYIGIPYTGDLSQFDAMGIATFNGELNSSNISYICYVEGDALYCDVGGITKITNGTFEDYGDIQGLNLSYNQISEIESGAFAGLSNLRELYLNNNYITNIDKGVFSGLESLEYLDLMENPLENVDYGYFDEIGHYPEIKDGFVWLTSDNLNEMCSIEYFDGDVVNIDCTGKGIEVIALGAFDNYDIISLNLNGNQIKNIQRWLFSGLENLENLDLGYNQISEIESGTFEGLSNLRELYLNNNYITNIDKGVFSGLESLEYLDLMGNPLVSTDYSDFEDMGINPNIRDGMLRASNIDMCYIELNPILNKKIIDCYGIGINGVEKGAFSNNLDVQIIYLDNNYLRELDSSIFEGLNLLEFISIGNNYYTGLDVSGIKEMGITVFAGELNDKNVNYVCGVNSNEYGKDIDCSNWGISKIASGAFLGLKSQIELGSTIIHLDNNDIITLEDGAFDGIYGLPTYVDLQDNEIDELNIDAFEQLYGGFNVGDYQYGDSLLEGWVNIYYLNGLDEDEEIDMIEYYGLDKYIAINLGSNILDEIEVGAFNGLINLQEINLSENNLSELDEKIFKDLENLQYLNLEDNDIKCIPEWLYNSDIRYEGLDDMQVCGLLSYDTIVGLCNLSEDGETLDCSNKGITYIDYEAFDFDELQGVKNVILSGNMISELNEDDFMYLPSLEYVNLEDNPLYCYPNFNEYFGYEEGGDDLINIDVDEGVPMCKELNSENLFEICDVILPGYFLEQYGPSESITYDENSNDFVIDCSNKGITSIKPYVFDGINMNASSNYIYLSGNLINRLDYDVFYGVMMDAQENNVIDLSNNGLEGIDCNVFESLVMSGAYNYLYLNNNKINNICGYGDYGSFSDMGMNASHFNGIYLNDNNISNIKQGSFSNLFMASPSNNIYLGDNNIGKLGNAVFDGLRMQSQLECPTVVLPPIVS